MPDKIACPYCDRKFDLDQVENADLWREGMAIASRMGAAWEIACEYADAFRAVRGGRISLKKKIRVLKDVLRLWEGERFSFDGKAYRVSKAAIVEALRAVCDADKTGFRDHNYLKRVMMNAGAERMSTEGLTARAESRREEDRRDGATEERRTLRDFREAHPEVAGLADTVGKEI